MKCPTCSSLSHMKEIRSNVGQTCLLCEACFFTTKLPATSLSSATTKVSKARCVKDATCEKRKDGNIYANGEQFSCHTRRSSRHDVRQNTDSHKEPEIKHSCAKKPATQHSSIAPKSIHRSTLKTFLSTCVAPTSRTQTQLKAPPRNSTINGQNTSAPQGQQGRVPTTFNKQQRNSHQIPKHITPTATRETQNLSPEIAPNQRTASTTNLTTNASDDHPKECDLGKRERSPNLTVGRTKLPINQEVKQTTKFSRIDRNDSRQPQPLLRKQSIALKKRSSQVSVNSNTLKTFQQASKQTTQQTQHSGSANSRHSSKQLLLNTVSSNQLQPNPNHPPNYQPNHKPKHQTNHKPKHQPNQQSNHQPHHQPNHQPNRQPNRQPNHQPNRQPNRQPNQSVEPRKRHTLHNRYIEVRLELLTSETMAAFGRPVVQTISKRLDPKTFCFNVLSDAFRGFKPVYDSKSNSNGELIWEIPVKYHNGLVKKMTSLKITCQPVTKNTLSLLPKIRSLKGFSDDRALISNLPKSVLEKLMDFQTSGIEFGLRRGGRCLIADEMGIGKTLQGLSLAYCYRSEWPLLVIVPAMLRTVWAAEIEKWFPDILPPHIQLVRSSAQIVDFSKPITITSFTMLEKREKEFSDQSFKVVVVDESHSMRPSHYKKPNCKRVEATCNAVKKAKRAILLSGTPCIEKPFQLYEQLNALHPGSLGASRKHFAQQYCNLKFVESKFGSSRADFSGGARLAELKLLISSIMMIRRLKKDVMKHLPPIRRQVCLVDVSQKLWMGCHENGKTTGMFSQCQELGIEKVPKIKEFLLHIISGTTRDQKIIIFAHHREVVKQIQQHVHALDNGGRSSGLNETYVLIQGETTEAERVRAVHAFQTDPFVRIAIVSITAGNYGFDLSQASHVVFAELPASPSDLLQAESRAHRRNQAHSCVNCYFLIARNTSEEHRWQTMSNRLECTSTLLNGTEKREKLDVDLVGILPDQGNGGGADKSHTSKLESVEIKNSPLKRSNSEAFNDNKLGSPNATPSPRPCRSVSSPMLLSPVQPFEMPPSPSPQTSTPLFYMASAHTDRIHLFRSRQEQDALGASFFIKDLFYVRDTPRNPNKAILSRIPDILSPHLHPANFKLACRFCTKWEELRKMLQNRLLNTIIADPEKDSEKVKIKYSNKRKAGRDDFISQFDDGFVPVEVEYVTRYKQVVIQKQKFNDESFALCIFCSQPYGTPEANPETGAVKQRTGLRAFFCSTPCYSQYCHQTSSSSLRRELAVVESGVCQKCKLDTRALFSKLRNLTPSMRYTELQFTNFSELSPERIWKIVKKNPLSEGDFWQADHVLAVHMGGGRCSLDNLQTLCTPCHALKTKRELEDIRFQKRNGVKNISLSPKVLKKKRRMQSNVTFAIQLRKYEKVSEDKKQEKTPTSPKPRAVTSRFFSPSQNSDDLSEAKLRENHQQEQPQPKKRKMKMSRVLLTPSPEVKKSRSKFSSLERGYSDVSLGDSDDESDGDLNAIFHKCK